MSESKTRERERKKERERERERERGRGRVGWELARPIKDRLCHSYLDLDQLLALLVCPFDCSWLVWPLFPVDRDSRACCGMFKCVLSFGGLKYINRCVVLIG